MASLLKFMTTVIPALTQIMTNGHSELGTLRRKSLPPHLTNNPMPGGKPWGHRTSEDTNPYEDAPFTGVIRSYDFTVSRGIIAPDGVERSVLLVNDRFPGPMIEANWGDTIQVRVHNNITGPEEGTAIHWHGILQKQTPYYDGVPGVDQCPIAPGRSFTYRFRADLYGTSWWHSHYSAQYGGGFVGPMIIYGPKNAPYDIDVGPIMLSDWNHEDYFNLVEQVMAPGAGPVFSDNNLLNGKMNIDCSKVSRRRRCTENAGLSKFKFYPSKIHRLRLINSGIEGIQQFRIDGHELTVIANDFVPVKPYKVPSVTLGIGQRTDVLVKGKSGAAGAAYWMRSDTVCGLAKQPSAVAAVYYPGADTREAPSSKMDNIAQQCLNDPLSKTTPYYHFGARDRPGTVQTIDITFGPNATGNNLWYMNGESFRVNYDNPILLLANMGNISYPQDPEWNVYNFGSNSSVRMIVRNFVGAIHPMHLHGHNFFVLAVGVGDWGGKITNERNPQRRDVQLLPAGSATAPGYIVLQWNQDNPATWPFHCHIAWHVSAGLYINVLERPRDITRRHIPSTLAQTCRQWWRYSGHHKVDQIDSGL